MKNCSNCNCSNKEGMVVFNKRLGSSYIWCKVGEGKPKPETHCCGQWKDKCVKCKGLLSCDKGGIGDDVFMGSDKG